MYTTAVGGAQDVQQTLMAMRHKTSGQQWQLSYVSGIVGAQPDDACTVVLPVFVACPHPPEQLPLCEFGVERRTALWHQMMTTGRAAVLRRAVMPVCARQSAHVLDYYGVKSSPFSSALACDAFWAWLDQHKSCLFVIMRLSTMAKAPSLFGIGWLCPQRPDAKFFALNICPCSIMTTHKTSGVHHHFIDYMLTRLYVSWADTRVHMLCDHFTPVHSCVNQYSHHR
jgi:hypothetical protein